MVRLCIDWIGSTTCLQQHGIQNQTNVNTKTTHTAVSFLGTEKIRLLSDFVYNSCLKTHFGLHNTLMTDADA